MFFEFVIVAEFWITKEGIRLQNQMEVAGNVVMAVRRVAKLASAKVKYYRVHLFVYILQPLFCNAQRNFLRVSQ